MPVYFRDIRVVHISFLQRKSHTPVGPRRCEKGIETSVFGWVFKEGDELPIRRSSGVSEG